MTYILALSEIDLIVDLVFNRIKGKQAARCTADSCTLTTVKYVIICGAKLLTFR